MKKFKKRLALVLVWSMILSMAITAYAQTEVQVMSLNGGEMGTLQESPTETSEDVNNGDNPEGKDDIEKPGDGDNPEDKGATEDKENPEDKSAPGDKEAPEDEDDPENKEEPGDKEEPVDEEEPEDKDDPENKEEPEDKDDPENKEEPEDKDDPENKEEPGDSDDEEDEIELDDSELEISELDIVLDDELDREMSELDETSLVRYNLGSCEILIAPSEYEGADDYFDENGNYDIYLGRDPFFPYEIQFSYDDKVETKWFMSPDESMEINGHVFTVYADFSGDVVTQLSLSIGGDTVTVYPESKSFTDELDDSSIDNSTLQPAEEIRLNVDLSSFSPLELTMVYVKDIFTGDRALSDSDKLAWRSDYFESDNGEYVVCAKNETLNLLYDYYYESDNNKWEMIVCKGDQIAADNIHYSIKVNTTKDKEWLGKSFAVRESKDTAETVSIEKRYEPGTSRSGYGFGSVRWQEYYTCNDGRYSATNGVLKLELSKYASRFSEIRVYEGTAFTAGEAMSNKDITSLIYGDSASGYDTKSVYSYFTIVGRDKSGNISGCMPVSIFIYMPSTPSTDIYTYFYIKNADGKNISYDNYSSYLQEGDVTNIQANLYKEYRDSDEYRACLDVNRNKGEVKVFLGHYSTLEEAKGSGAENEITGSILSHEICYKAKYNRGVSITIFDGDTPYRCVLKVSEGTVPEFPLSGDTLVKFTGLIDRNGNPVTPVYSVTPKYDSLGERNYPVMIVGDKNVDLSWVAPVFTMGNDNIHLYSGDNATGTVEVSGKSYHDFSKGSVHYTASAEDRLAQRNYWLTILKAEDGAGKLTITGEGDGNSNLIEKNGVIYLDREVKLDSYHNYYHDVFVTNVGMDSIPDLKAELNSKQLVLDSFWTMNGGSDLPGYQKVLDDIRDGKESLFDADGSLHLSNIARVRLRLKDGANTAEDVSGTLKFKSGNRELIVINLKGVGDPVITTKKIPDAVKYVPYGFMIQNNNKYSYITPSYTVSGKLPGGMELKPNGELYGVPREKGKFTFTVTMNNGGNYGKDTKKFTITVKDNTDGNVDKSTDEKYDVTDRIEYLIMTTDPNNDQTFRSLGELGELVDVWIDGEILSESEYKKEEGSTVITVNTQVLKDKVNSEKGRHTFALEYRNENNELKRAAQNYYIDKKTGSGGGGGSSSGGTESGGGGGGESGGSSGGGSGILTSLQNAWDTIKPNTNKSPAITEISYVIQPGDSLGGIALKYLGSRDAWRQIYEDNRSIIRNPNLIYVGQTIIIRIAGPSEASVGDAGQRTYTVVRGDNLFRISRKVYGTIWHWNKIYEANSNIITNPARISIGQVFVVPDLY